MCFAKCLLMAAFCSKAQRNTRNLAKESHTNRELQPALAALAGRETVSASALVLAGC